MTDIPAACDQVSVTPTCPSPGITINYKKTKNEVTRDKERQADRSIQTFLEPSISKD